MELSVILQPEIPTLEALTRRYYSGDVSINVLQQINYLYSQADLKPFIKDCNEESIKRAVRYAVDNNLTLDPNETLVYLMPEYAKIDGKFVQTLRITPTADGKISIAKQAGTILDSKRPTVKTETGSKRVISACVEIQVPTFDAKGNPATRWEPVEIDEYEFERLKSYSHKKNARTWKQESGKPKPDLATLNYANPLYTSYFGGIDPEFARAKVVSNALKKRGTNRGAAAKNIVNPIAIEAIKKEDEFTVFEEVKIVQTAPVHTTSTAATLFPDANDL